MERLKISPASGMAHSGSPFAAPLPSQRHSLSRDITSPDRHTSRARNLPCPRKTHLATLAGHHSGRAVSFVKTYDPPGFGYDTVAYSGELNADNSEIAGMWTIEGGLSGAFLMVRARPLAAAKARSKLAAVE